MPGPQAEWAQLLDVPVAAARGMTDAEALRFLATGIPPDDPRTSTPEPNDVEDGDRVVLGEGDALALLAGIPVLGLTADGFDPAQPRDDNGRWTDDVTPSKTRLTSVRQVQGARVGDVLGISKNGRRRVRRGRRIFLYVEERGRDGEWRRSAKYRVPDFFEAPPGKKRSPVEDEKWLIPSEMSSGKRPRVVGRSTPRTVDREVGKRFDAALAGDEVLASPTISVGDESSLADRERDALDSYRYEQHHAVNSYYRAEPDARRNPIDDVMSRSHLRDDVIVHRGVARGRKVFGDAWDGNLVGLEYRDGGYSSTSTDKSVTDDFTDDDDGAVLNILVPAGTPAVAFDTESEVLLDRGLRFRVVADYLDDGVRNLDVEVI